jgi:tRNA nucleotidyltransferase (CCA-adding enzyme)
MPGPSTPAWEHFHHEADIGVRGIGATLEQAFEQAALAVTAVILDPVLVSDGQSITLEAEGPDRELLLTAWINAVIYEMATRRMLFRRFEVQISDQQLQATAWGEPIDVAKHRPAVEVKGATFTELRVEQSLEGHWSAQCVVDV